VWGLFLFLHCWKEINPAAGRGGIRDKGGAGGVEEGSLSRLRPSLGGRGTRNVEAWEGEVLSVEKKGTSNVAGGEGLRSLH